MSYISLKEALQVIHESGGAAFLAHPRVNVGMDQDLLSRIIALGIDGIEVYSSYHSPEEAAYFNLQARRHHLGISAGSDFHGRTKPAVSLGKHGCPDENQVQQDLHDRCKIYSK